MSAFGRVAVVGAGWAGLACATELAAAEIPVTVFEASRQLGGRSRSVALEGYKLDNGQHLLVGAYSETLRLMHRVGAEPASTVQRTPLRLDYPGVFRLQLPELPAPWHLAIGLFTATGASLREKLSAALFMQRLKRQHYRLDRDTTVADWLNVHGQTGTLRRYLWEPLCLAALNTPPARASAQIFANVLRDSLGGSREATDLLLQQSDLGQIFPEPAARFIADHGGELRLSTRVGEVHRQGNGWLIGDEHFEQIVLAVAPQHLAPLLASRPAHTALLEQVASYRYEAIATAYLAYPEAVRLPFPMLGLRGPIGQWVFDRREMGSAGVMAFVLSAEGDWDKLEDEALAHKLHAELEATVGPLPAPQWQRSIRERRATFSCQPGLPRPGTETAERGLWLAGDYTYGDYPATLEGAVRSGVAAARKVRGGR